MNQIGLDLAVFEAIKPNWTEAQTFCHAFGGELASVPDQGTNDFLAQLTSEEAWIGGHKVEHNIRLKILLSLIYEGGWRVDLE